MKFVVAVLPSEFGLARQPRLSCTPPSPRLLSTTIDRLNLVLSSQSFSEMTSIYIPTTAIGLVTSLSGHATAYRWRSQPRVRRHRARSPQKGSSSNVRYLFKHGHEPNNVRPSPTTAVYFGSAAFLVVRLRIMRTIYCFGDPSTHSTHEGAQPLKPLFRTHYANFYVDAINISIPQQH